MRFTRKVRPGARIEMIPLIDIIFLLLVVVIYAMLSMTVHKGIRVELPRAATAEVDKKDHFSVSIADKGHSREHPPRAVITYLVTHRNIYGVIIGASRHVT